MRGLKSSTFYEISKLHYLRANADALVIYTEWPTFKVPDFKLLKSQLNSPVIFDGRNLYDPLNMKENGFIYFGI
jgi:UDPglucose 6-dehydrogenase